VTPTVAISPFERIFSEGYIYRQAVAAPRKLIVVIGIWLVFLPLFLSGGMMLVWDTFSREMPMLYVFGAVFTSIIGGLGLFQVTRNYLRRPRSNVEAPAEG
jgi:hypothetical protein